MIHSIPENDKQFYPTPPRLASILRSKINWDCVRVVLDPQAGKGDLLEIPLMKSKTTWAIEIDPNLRSILKSKGHRIIGSDFLNFDGREQPDAIVMNPPFKSGAEHLLTAINYLFSGQIACILNAETIRNPYSNQRKLLIQKLNELGAEIQFESDQFMDSERKTGVEIAIIYIDKRIEMEESIFSKCKDKVNEYDVNEISDSNTQLVNSDRIKASVERYNSSKDSGINLLVEFYKNSRGVPFIKTNICEESGSSKLLSLADKAKADINYFLSQLRKGFWIELMQDPSVEKYLTKKKKEQYRKEIEDYSSIDFTENNIREFVYSVCSSYSKNLTEATMELFDTFTAQHSWYTESKKNIYLFTGWKSNNAFKVNKKIVLPHFHSIDSYDKSWKKRADYRWENIFNDFDKIMSYFDSGKSEYISLYDAVYLAFENRQYSKIESEYFYVTFYKKGTMHLTFKDDDILRRFNIFCCINRGELPCDYAQREYDSKVDKKEKDVVESFEGNDSYKVDEKAQPFKKNYSLSDNVNLFQIGFDNDSSI